MDTPSSGTTASTPSENSTAASSSIRNRDTSGKSSIALYLENACIDGVLALNDRDYDYSNGDLYKNASSTFRAHFVNFPNPLTLAEHSALMQQLIERFPEHHIEVQSVSSDVDEESGVGTVCMSTEVTGAPPGTRFVQMSMFRWRRDGRAWRCWLHEGMNGVSDHG